MSEPHRWSEAEWEAFIEAQERRLARFMEYVFEFIRRYPPPPSSEVQALEAWEERLARFLQRKTGWAPGASWQVLWMLWEPDELEEEEEGSLFVAEQSWPQGLEQLPVYRQASRTAREVLDWTDALPGEAKDSTLVHFCTLLTQVGGYIARGYGFGYDRDTIGGYIVCIRRALQMANTALETLRELRQAPYMTPETYLHFYEQVYELRNALALHLQALRERRALNID